MLSRALRAPWWTNAGLAVGGASIAVALTRALQLEERPFLLPMIAVLMTALRGGLAAGLTSAVVTLGLANYFVIPPIGSLKLRSLQSAYDLGFFGLTAGVIATLAARRRQAQLTLEATVASIGEGVIVTDHQARVRFLNSVAERLTGWTMKEADDQPIKDVFNVIREETREPIANPIERALREGTAVDIAPHALLLCRDGSELPIADSGAPIRNEHGRTIGAVLVFRDSTPQRRVEESFRHLAEERLQLLERERAARAEAEHANRLKDDFLATLSHELRTPLNAVIGWSHMLRTRQLPEQQQRQALAAIHRNALAQARLVEDVLDLSRIVTGQMALAAEGVDIAEIVRTTAESFAPALQGKRQTMRLELTDGAEITGDPHRLRQVTWNLLSNATKFTPDGGTITVRVERVASRIALSVIDTGQGIDPSFLPYVFDRFRQGDSSPTRDHGGLGLGLSLVRHLVEAHGGVVSASSDGAGRGATLTVSFPTRAETPSDARPGWSRDTTALADRDAAHPAGPPA